MDIETLIEEIATAFRVKPDTKVHIIRSKTWQDHSWTVMGNYLDRATLVELEPWGELWIKLDCESSFLFTVSKRSLAGHFEFWRGKQIKLGDEKFDHVMGVRAYDRQKVSSWLMDQDVRRAVLSLFPFNRLEYRENLLQYKTDIDIENAKIHAIISQLNTLNNIAQ